MRSKLIAVSLITILLYMTVGNSIACGPPTTQYDLTISSTEGGDVTAPAEGTHTYGAGEEVDLVATADGGYQFVSWTGDVGTIADANDATTTITMNGDYSIAAEFAEPPENIWLSGLMTDLQNDTTDANEVIVDVYEAEHFARDLEDNLEELGYRVGYLVVFQYGSTSQPLQWETLVKVYYSNTFCVLVNPETDSIVTRDYDGNSDGVVDTLLNPGVSEVSSRWDTLIETRMGNDGKYLLLEFDDYDEVQLVERVPPEQPQESTYPEVYEKLKIDLAEDETDKNTYIKDDYDCDDFARDLEKALEAKNYTVSIKAIWWYDWVWQQPEQVWHEGYWIDYMAGIWHPGWWEWPEGWWEWEIVGHCIVNVHLRYQLISAAGTTVVDTSVAIEPQNGPCTEDVTSTYDGNGDGEIDVSSSPATVNGAGDYGNFKESGWQHDKDGKRLKDKDGNPIPQQGTGTDGKYRIEEYDKFDDIPFPVDPGKLSPKEQAKQPK
jgi:hypothetical protein